jgi:hypothetical protein
MKGLFVVFAILVATLGASPSFAADQRNVTVVNGTGYGIKFLGFNNPGDNDWSENELGGVLANGGNIYVKFNTSDKGCKWNFKIEWADPGYPGVLWQNIDLCSIDEITLKYDRDTDKTTAIVKRAETASGRSLPLRPRSAFPKSALSSPAHQRCGLRSNRASGGR